MLSAATVGKQREEAAISTVTGERDLNTTVRIQRERVNKRAKEFHERQNCVTWFISGLLWRTSGPVSHG